MKKELIDEEHCPYCKRHCSLSNPHCKKGKALAEEKKNEVKKTEVKKTEVKKMKEDKNKEDKNKEGKSKEGKSKEDKNKEDKIKEDKNKEDKNKEDKKIKQDKKIKNEILIDQKSETDHILLDLFQKCSQSLPYQEGDKTSNKVKKLHISSLLAEKGELTKQELEVFSELSSDELDKLLNKMENKEYITWQQVDLDKRKVSLTKNGFKFANKHISEREGSLNPFSNLNEEEKGNLEFLLQKLYTDWSN